MSSSIGMGTADLQQQPSSDEYKAQGDCREIRNALL